MRESLLAQDPEIHSLDMSTLVAIANAIEHESVERYALLAGSMERRGELATAAAFRVMLEEERRHVDAVGKWATALGQQESLLPRFEWELPSDLSTSWEEASGSALLTPYRAFAIAAENEMRAFAFYTFLSARADDDRVREQAERLASEELRHASLVRQWRRQAWHRERRRHKQARAQVDTIEALHELLAAHESEIVDRHYEIASRLRASGDEESAALLENLRELAWQAPSSASAPVVPDLTAAMIEASPMGAEVAMSPGPEDPAHLLVEAQRPLERLAEALEAVMANSEGALFGETDRAMAGVVARLGPISLQIGKCTSRAAASIGATGSRESDVHREGRLLTRSSEVQEGCSPTDRAGNSPNSSSSKTLRRQGDLPSDSLGRPAGNQRRGASWYRR